MAKGKAFIFSAGSKEGDDPSNADTWGADRVLEAEKVAWLCTDRQASDLVTRGGIIVSGMRIDGLFDLSFARVPFVLIFAKCAFRDEISLIFTEFPGLSLDESRVKGVMGTGLKSEGDVHLQHLHAEGEISLRGATIGGELDCRGAHIISTNGLALAADNLKVGRIDLEEVTAEGQIHLIGATIVGQLNCQGAHIVYTNGSTLVADHLRVGGSILLHYLRSEGEARLLNATIGGNLECDDAQFINAGGFALSIDGADIQGGIFLTRLKAQGEVRLPGSTIGKDLGCDGARIRIGRGI